MKRILVVSVGLAALMVGVVLAWYSVRRDREFQRLIATGDAALAQDQTSAAIEAFSGALALKRDSMVGYLKRGDTYRRRGAVTDALDDLRAASALDPTAPRPVELLGDVTAAMGALPQAIEHYRNFTLLDDRSPRVLHKLGLTYYRNGQAAQAIEPLRQALALDSQLAEAHYVLGLCLREQGEDAAALASLTTAVRLSPAFTAAREALVGFYIAHGRRREAIDQLEALAALEPAQPERLVNVGLAYAQLGRTDEAVLTLGRAAERYPDQPIVYAALGRVWLGVADAGSDRAALNKAVEALRSAASAVTASSETLTLYGRAMLMSGNPAAAEQTLRDATMRSPVDPLAYRYLAAAATRLGHERTASAASARFDALTTVVPASPGPGDLAGRRPGS